MRKYCNDFSIDDINKVVKLYGWVSNIRILKCLIFIILKDSTGYIQILVKKNNNKLWNLSLSLSIESCIGIKGIIKKKYIKGNKNNKDIEIVLSSIKIFNYSKSLPLDMFSCNSNLVKYKYRYLDLRKPEILNIFKNKSDIKFFIHKFFNKFGFLDIETPFLSKSFPEGANDYIVQSRIYSNKFYSLPQSPQIFKQLLMISGINKYYQIVKCFRDEDLRIDRQSEFTQIDIELSFFNFNDIRFFVEKLICDLWLNFKKINISLNFPLLDYNDSIDLYGTDKPDLRNSLKFNKNISIFLKKGILSEFKLCFIKSIIIDNYFGDLNLNFLFDYLKKKNVYCYLCIRIISKINGIYNYKFNGKYFCDNDWVLNFLKKFDIKSNSLILIFILKKEYSEKDIIDIRNFLSDYFNFKRKSGFFPVWIVNFPMFFIDKNKNISTHHHPFTKPFNENDLYKSNYLDIISSSYDLVINGYEIGSGSKRINNFNIQKKVFDILNISKSIQIKKYGFFLEALKYGTPPHLGIALGLDRIVMLLNNILDIKSVIAFPKTSSGICLLTEAPD